MASLSVNLSQTEASRWPCHQKPDPEKPRILLCWPYHRSGFRDIFEPLRQQFEFHYLWWVVPPEQEAVYLDPTYSWREFHGAQDIISKIAPSRVVFLGLDAPHTTVVLNRACKESGIETLWVQHGILWNFQELVDYETHSPTHATLSVARLRIAWELLLFSLRSFTPNDLLPALHLAKWIAQKRLYGDTLALQKNKSTYRLADKYIVFTKENASPLLRHRDGVAESSIFEIGYPQFDEFVARIDNVTVGDYYLLIDTPLLKEVGFQNEEIEQRRLILQRIFQYCQTRHKRLVVKVHPQCYKSPRLLLEPQVDYVHDSKDLVGLILGAKAVFGYFSTLLLIAVYFKPCCVYRIGSDNDLYRAIEELKLGKVLTTDQSPMDEEWEEIPKSSMSLETFAARFLYKPDGRARIRLAQALLGANRPD